MPHEQLEHCGVTAMDAVEISDRNGSSLVSGALDPIDDGVAHDAMDPFTTLRYRFGHP